MRVLLVFILLVLALGGCAQPPATGTPPAMGAARSSLDVDLETRSMRVPMPAAQPTMAIALNVTESMWVHPFVGGLGANAPDAPVRDASYVVLCAWLHAEGLPDKAHWVVLPFWLEGQTLVPADEYTDATDAGFTNAYTRGCEGSMSTPPRSSSLSADRPRAGTLVLVATAYLQIASDARPPEPPPAFDFIVGIGRECSDEPFKPEGPAFCIPDARVATEPLARAAMPLFAFYQGFEDETGAGTGFEVRDDRSGVGPLAGGALRVSRDSVQSQGLTFMFALVGWEAGGGGAQPQDLGTPTHDAAVSATVDGSLRSPRCTNAQAAWVQISVAHDNPIRIDALVEASRAYAAFVQMLEIPLDVATLGWTVTPRWASDTLQTNFGGPKTCE